MALDSRRELFIREYLNHFNGAQAARDIGISEGSARSWACRTLAEPEVQDRIAELMAERSRRAEIRADEVLKHIHAIATTDTNEIIQYRRVCCRHCWGAGFRYQYTSNDKLREAERKFNTTLDALVDDFEHGGTGFDPRKEPNGDCPECHGEGFGEVHIRDTRLLSSAARAMYAGAKLTKDGVEIKIHDKSKHLELLARHLGLLNDKLDVNVKGDLAERLAAGRKRVGAA